MRRLISQRAARIALAGIAVAGVVLVVAGVRGLRGRPAVRPAVPSVETWPPDPVLGRPTPADLERYGRPARVPAFLSRSLAREPTPDQPVGRRVGRRVDRRLVRWGSVVIALGVFVFGGQLLDEAVFGTKEPAREAPPPSAEPTMAGSTVLDPECLRQLAEAEAAGATMAVTLCPGPVASPDEVILPPADTVVAEQAPGCAPAPAEPAVRPVGAKVTRAVARQWRRVERWLKTNAPKTYGSLRAPGKARTIAIAESQTGVRFPDDLRASLLRHNGAHGPAALGFGFSGGRLLSVREIRDGWRAACAVPVSSGHELYGDRHAGRRSDWHGRLIPVTAAGVGGRVIVDSAAGSAGLVSRAGEVGMRGGWSSYYTLLKSAAEAMETGGSVDGRRPVVRDGALVWKRVG
ncbi:SMI1/KNR4 family protein [Streptosporangium soli]|nr:hypothetical protein [Streptosporangium sp. KLBMP 9127]